MGNNYEGQEKAIEDLKALSPEAKKFLSHHICNSLQAILGGLEMGRFDIAKREIWHIVDDLILAGIKDRGEEEA